MSAKDGKTRKSDKKFILLIVILVIVILALLATVIYLWHQKPSGKVKKEKPLIVNEDNADTILGELEDDSMDTMYNCRMSTTWTFENGKAESKDAYVANTDYNHYTVYFEVEIDDTKEIVYTSPYLPVGSEINGLTLDKPLDAGEYPATVNYHLVDDNNKEISSVGFTVTIQVLN